MSRESNSGTGTATRSSRAAHGLTFPVGHIVAYPVPFSTSTTIAPRPPGVSNLRTLLSRHRWLAMWLVGAALLMKMLVPAGFMPAMSNGTILVQLCSSTGVRTVAMEMPGLSGQSGGQDQHAVADQPCVFSGLSIPGLAGADPLLLAIAIAFIMATGRRTAPAAVIWRHNHVRPPSRAPPATV